MDAPLHPDLEPLRWLVGTWVGAGSGGYPTIEPFAYLETVTFSHVGKPFLAYAQRTKHPTEGHPMHREDGFLRSAGPGRVELVVAHPTGHVEVAAGTIDGTTITLRSTTVVGTDTAKSVTALERDLTFDGDVLRYELRMAAVGQPTTHHLAGELRRAP